MIKKVLILLIFLLTSCAPVKEQDFHGNNQNVWFDYLYTVAKCKWINDNVIIPTKDTIEFDRYEYFLLKNKPIRIPYAKRNKRIIL